MGDKELAPAQLLMTIMNYRESASGSFRFFIESLYETGQQGIFPRLAQYSDFQAVTLEILEGNFTQPEENILLEPYFFWQILNGQLTRYPGSYSDFSTPLAHMDLRRCWCVDEAGQQLQGTSMEPRNVQACE